MLKETNEGSIASTEGTLETVPRQSELKRFNHVFFGRPLVIVGIFFITVVLVMAIFAPLLAPYDPYDQNLVSKLKQPNHEHPLGTDGLGRDVLSRIIYGSRISLLVAAGALVIAIALGVFLGLAAGYLGGIIYTIIMRATDALMAFPMLLLALVIAGLIGGGLLNIVLALGIALMPGFVRLMCGQVLSVRENDYILAERAMGASNRRIMLRHVAPNSFPPILVQITLWVGAAILAEAGLSFLGVGIKPPSPSWGSMINDGYKYVISNPVLSFAPGVAIMLTVFGFNMIGDGLRDALDPRLRGKL